SRLVKDSFSVHSGENLVKVKEVIIGVTIALVGLGVYFFWQSNSTRPDPLSQSQRPTLPNTTQSASVQPSGIWGVANEPFKVSTDQDHFNSLVGSWRWTSDQGFSSTFAFDVS